MTDADRVNERRTPKCGHPKAGTAPDEVNMLWCNDCKVVYNMNELACTEAEFKELFINAGWTVIGSGPKKG